MDDYKVGDINEAGYEITSVYHKTIYVMKKRIIITDVYDEKLMGEKGWITFDTSYPLPMFRLDNYGDKAFAFMVSNYMSLSDYRKEKIKKILQDD